MKKNFTLKGLLLLIVTLCLVGCESIENVGKSTGVFQSLSTFAIWSMWWLIPALSLYSLFIIDKKESKTLSDMGYSSGSDGQIYEFNTETGKMVKGNPVVAEITLFFWLLFYPLVYFYWPIFKGDQKLELFGSPDLDGFVVKFIIPISIVIGSIIIAYFSSKSTKEIAKVLKKVFQTALVLGVLNLGLWGLMIFSKWLFHN